ncbi:hypothetical protein [Marispirochaeta sp.]|jgi:hypothetical protein|uniref:hypothetical protein n=1 Tax=Marispirochaeta sp. TaxID=2038653 RepID=UPI0029C8A34F|nr:hypothetical protein [Marispirochaeta sp.]
MVEWEDMTPEERDRFIYLSLSENALKAIVMIMQRKHGPDVSTETIMRYAFTIARDRMTPKHLKQKSKNNDAMR